MAEDPYRQLNRELSMEVQKLRIIVAQQDDQIKSLRNAAIEREAENTTLRSFISSCLREFTNFSNEFSNKYIELVSSGIQITLPSENDSIRSSMRRSEEIFQTVRQSRAVSGYSIPININYPSGYVGNGPLSPQLEERTSMLLEDSTFGGKSNI